MPLLGQNNPLKSLFIGIKVEYTLNIREEKAPYFGRSHWLMAS